MTASGILNAADVMMATGRIDIKELGGSLNDSSGLVLFRDGMNDPWALSGFWGAAETSVDSVAQTVLSRPIDLVLLNDVVTSTQSWIANGASLSDGDLWATKVQWVLETPTFSHYSDSLMGFGGAASIIALVVGFLIYFLPFFIAAAANHRKQLGIFALNLFLGFTFVGWLAALNWSLNRPKEDSDERKAIAGYAFRFA